MPNVNAFFFLLLHRDNEYIILLVSKQKEIKCASCKEDKPVLW